MPSTAGRRKAIIPGHQVHDGLFSAAGKLMAFIQDHTYHGLTKTERQQSLFTFHRKILNYYDHSLYSFNVPEFVKGRIRYNGRNMINAIDSDPKSVIFEVKE
jgi:hypothetical protein